MRSFDIISESPTLFLFEKESNKTNFGGFLFLIYFVIILLIIIYYVVDYVENDKYVIQSFSHFNYKSQKEIQLINKNELFNPNINFSMHLEYLDNDNDTYINIDNKFLIYDNNASEFIDIKNKFNKQINKFDVVILYECKNSNCSDYYDYISSLNIEQMNDFYLTFNYDGFSLDHQSPKQPILRDDTFSIKYQLNFNSTMDIKNIWRNIIYNEQKEFLQSDYRDSCGYVENYNTFSHGYIKTTKLKKINDKKYLKICQIKFNINYKQYTEYFRNRVSELDLLANIFSLVANIFEIVKMIFGFYSGNFNSFKIVEKLLNKSPPSPKNKFKKITEINNINDNDNKFLSINDDISEKCLNDDDKNNNEIMKNTDEEENEENENDDLNAGENKKIQKIRFFDFFLNNLNFCCKKRKQQKIIDICNDLVSKYSSIDIMIKNQILFENLYQDYKWNDPGLNSIEKNNLFVQLNTYL